MVSYRSHLHEAPEGASVAEVVLHVVADAVAAGGAVAEVAQVAVLPVVVLVSYLVLGRVGAGSACLAGLFFVHVSLETHATAVCHRITKLFMDF